MLAYTAKMAAFSAKELLKERVHPLEAVQFEARAWPWLCDYQRHINNARYLDMMDYGRFQWFVRVGLTKPLYSEGWNGVVAATQITYRSEVPLMKAFTLETKLVGWDDRWYFHEQRFLLEDGRIAAQAFLRSSLRSKKGAVNIGDALAKAGYPGLVAPETTPELQAFIDSTAQTAKSLKGR